eukprot:TRINITY_DN6391_c0_g1_i2.p1 TRINITY_DN6391_c0_g1~~TRINITY_DN6391_c0_g1_i2.p1  ORF type:complete len:527 (+),score=95.94 TRINITY_DN6391_c0_g1_i2:60-1640(+)
MGSVTGDDEVSTARGRFDDDVQEEWQAWQGELTSKRHMLDAGEVEESAYFVAVEEDANRLEEAAKELHKRLLVSCKVIDKYKSKYKHQKYKTREVEAELERYKRMREVGNYASDDHLHSRLSTHSQGLVDPRVGMESKSFRDEIDRLEKELQEKNDTIECLRSLTAGAPGSIPPVAVDDRATTRELKDRIKLLEGQLKVERKNSERLSSLILHRDVDPFHKTHVRSHSAPHEAKEKRGALTRTEDDSFLLGSTPTSPLRQGLGRGRVVYVGNEASSLSAATGAGASRLYIEGGPQAHETALRGVAVPRRFDRAIERRRETDYWVPEDVFRFTAEFRNKHFPRSSLELFYQYMIRCNTVWRCVHSRSVSTLEKRHRDEVADLKRQARRTVHRIEEISASINLRDLQREIVRYGKSVNGYVGVTSYVKRLRTAVSGMEELAARLAAVELENDRLRHLTDPDAQQETMLRRFQTVLRELHHAVSAKCDDYQSLIDANSPALSVTTNAVVNSILSSFQHFTKNLASLMQD